jgi:calnexin
MRRNEQSPLHFPPQKSDQSAGRREAMKDAQSVTTDKVNHLYTLIVRPDNSFEILNDAESLKQGNLLKDFSPSVAPPNEIASHRAHRSSRFVL